MSRHYHVMTDAELEEARRSAEPFSPEELDALLEQTWRLHRTPPAEEGHP